MNTGDLMNADYPIPDPAWDYATIYQNCQQAREALRDLIEFMSQFEDGSADADTEIKVRLDAIGQRLNQTRRMMDEG